ncbi:unnamed protein product [Brugia pahangi]|uniref:PDZ domain-containing protein n=1 Tax=Brugia pahangi TaxID=6280 RepID=A0A158PQ91_BRUPA|nr:unnamed protein product [Brugia pahangi]
MMKVPPNPPPKPRMNQLQYRHGLSRSIAGGGQLPPQPGDSDTDSGICADSDNQLSPRHINSGFFDNKSKKLRRKFDMPVYREYLTPKTAWGVHTNLSALPYQKCLPERLQTNRNSQTSRNGKQHRVRFADQVLSMDGSSLSSSSGCDNINLVAVNSCANYSGCFLHYPSMETAILTSPVSSNNPDLVLPAVVSRSNSGTINKLSGQHHAIDYQFNFGYSSHVQSSYDEDDRTLPGYSAPMTRLIRNDNQCITHPNESSYRVMRRFRNRSASLPRGMHCESSALEMRRGSIDCCYPPQSYSSYKSKDEATINNSYLMRSVDNLSVMERGHDSVMDGTRLSSGCRLPDLSLDCTVYDGATQQQPIFGRQRRVRRVSGRSQSVGRAYCAFDSKMANSYMNSCVPLFHRSHLPTVRAQLIALDHRGLRIVLIEKLQPGPFGFYIATGIFNQKHGIFVSRVSLPSLTSVLSVGDEIIYVEDELVKGEDLEYVQALIAGKSSVKIVLLPIVGPGAC